MVEVITEVLDKAHFGEDRKHEVSGALRKRDLGVRQPRPVVGIRPPRVGVLEGEREPVVDGRDVDLGLKRIT